MRNPGDRREGRKFTSGEALAIRKLVRQAGKSQAEVARMYGCSVRTVFEIVTRMCYKEVTEDFYWKIWECAPGMDFAWLKARMDANDIRKRNDRVDGKNRRKPRGVV